MSNSNKRIIFEYVYEGVIVKLEQRDKRVEMIVWGKMGRIMVNINEEIIPKIRHFFNNLNDLEEDQ